MSEGRQAILRAASRNADLLREVPAVVAAGFGILALQRRGDVLTVACSERMNRQALQLLRDVLELEIVATPFEEAPLREAIQGGYFPRGETVNFPTFRDSGFLDESRSAALLRHERVERPDPARWAIPAGSLVLVSWTYRAWLRNTDAPRTGGALPDPERIQLGLGPLEIGWRIASGRPEVRLDGPLPRTPAVIVTQYRFSELQGVHAGGILGEHHVRTDVVTGKPLVVHPTEVQLTGVEPDGTLLLHVYDRTVSVLAGRPGTIDLGYYFLSYGNRMHRRIEIEVHEVERVSRDWVRELPGDLPWSGRELRRWLDIGGRPRPRGGSV